MISNIIQNPNSPLNQNKSFQGNILEKNIDNIDDNKSNELYLNSDDFDFEEKIENCNKILEIEGKQRDSKEDPGKLKSKMKTIKPKDYIELYSPKNNQFLDDFSEDKFNLSAPLNFRNISPKTYNFNERNKIISKYVEEELEQDFLNNLVFKDDLVPKKQVHEDESFDSDSSDRERDSKVYQSPAMSSNVSVIASDNDDKFDDIEIPLNAFLIKKNTDSVEADLLDIPTSDILLERLENKKRGRNYIPNTPPYTNRASPIKESELGPNNKIITGKITATSTDNIWSNQGINTPIRDPLKTNASRYSRNSSVSMSNFSPNIRERAQLFTNKPSSRPPTYKLAFGSRVYYEEKTPSIKRNPSKKVISAYIETYTKTNTHTQFRHRST